MDLQTLRMIVTLRAADLHDLATRFPAHEQTLREMASREITKVVNAHDVTPHEAAQILTRRGH